MAVDQEWVRQWITGLKADIGGCQRCPAKPNEYWGWEAFDWDHIIGKKRFNIGEIAFKPFRAGSTMEEIVHAVVQEVEKCQLLCSNCHRTITKSRKTEKRQQIQQQWSSLLDKWARKTP
jgi:hypothetical protein